MQADIVIIGAGLAGLSAAQEIASRTRASVIVVERRVAGSNNPTPMTFADVPERYGLEDCVIGRYTRFTFHSPLGNQSSHSFDAPRLVALDYQKACLKLLERADAAGNVWLYTAAATGLKRHGAGWLVPLNDGHQIQARLVIDASGRGLFSSRVLDLPRPREFSHCLGARLSNCRVPDPQEAFFIAPTQAYGNGGGWLYPLDGGQVSFGFATLGRTNTLPGRIVKANFQRALLDLEPYATWLKEAKVRHAEVGSIPIYPLRRFVYDGLLVAGDAAGQATIWSCMGSEAALEAGRMAGEAAVNGWLRSDFSARTLEGYQRAWDARHRRTYRNNAWIEPVVWSMPEKEWNRQIPLVQKLTPDQMVERLRVNYPVPTLPQAAFVRLYDMAGRARRGLVRRLRSRLASQPIRGLRADQ